MKNVFYLLVILALLTAACKKQSTSIISSMAGKYTCTGVDSATVILDTNTHFGTTVSTITDTSFSIQVVNDTTIIITLLGEIDKFSGEVFYNELHLVRLDRNNNTLNFYAPASTPFNTYAVSPYGEVSTRTEYLAYNYSTHTITYDCYETDDVNEHWALHLTGKK